MRAEILGRQCGCTREYVFIRGTTVLASLPVKYSKSGVSIKAFFWSDLYLFQLDLPMLENIVVFLQTKLGCADLACMSCSHSWYDLHRPFLLVVNGGHHETMPSYSLRMWLPWIDPASGLFSSKPIIYHLSLPFSTTWKRCFAQDTGLGCYSNTNSNFILLIMDDTNITIVSVPIKFWIFTASRTPTTLWAG